MIWENFKIVSAYIVMGQLIAGGLTILAYRFMPTTERSDDERAP